MSARLVPMAAARLKHETKLRIQLLGRVEKLAAELREHLALDYDTSDDLLGQCIDATLERLLSQVERAPFKTEPAKPADAKPASE